MSNASMTVMPILATPLGIATIPEAELLNLELNALFTQRAAADDEALAANPLRYCSRDDLLDWPEAPARRLGQHLIGAVYSLVGSVSEIGEAQLRSLRLEARAWFTLVRTNGSIPAANYPMTAWCAIYCVAAPQAVDGRADSGVVRLYESRLGTTFQDASNAALRIPYASSHYAWRPAAGQMVIFPASLTHEIALLRAAQDLILVTARLRFIAPGQQGFSRW
jgi:Putative 2OG-Fe(II) oxygenase